MRRRKGEPEASRKGYEEQKGQGRSGLLGTDEADGAAKPIDKPKTRKRQGAKAKKGEEARKAGATLQGPQRAIRAWPEPLPGHGQS